MENKNLKAEFKTWMRKQINKNNVPFTEGTISSYANSLSHTPPKLDAGEQDLPDLYTITDPEEFEAIKLLLENTPNYDEVNKHMGNKALYYGTEYYLKFLKERAQSNTLSVTNPPATKGENIILFGPPGTGKTYSTTAWALAKIEGKDVSAVQSEMDQSGYDAIRKRFEEYRKNGRIAFTTFHQSYGYEEFIEGIKPIMESNLTEDSTRTLEYEIKAGVFKQFCDRAKAPVIQEQNHLGIRKNPSIWKVSLKGSKLHNLKQDCFTHDRIRIGWDLYGEEPDNTTDYSSAGGKKVIAHFINEMQIGDIVLTLKNERTIDAVGVITGDYEWLPDETDYRRSRKVNWLLKNIDQDIFEMNGNTVMTLASVYRLHRLTLEDVLGILEKHHKISADAVQKNEEQYVFIIDEINRGNISKIFGELITLIEPSKRLGRPEAMKLRLPYSQSEFGVPDNVTILATMNTADRSIAQLDTALRRRFRFIELLPEPSLLQSIDLESIQIDAMLAKMNERIEVIFDRDHVIGHAFFMPLRDNPHMQKLADIFRHSIIPLLQEYFYDDWQMIRLVLGDHEKDLAHQFVQEITVDPAKLFGSSSIDLGERKMYRLQEAALLEPAAYKGIYE